MMEELCYSALDLAIIIGGMDLGCRAKASLLENIWEMERPFLEEIYRKNKRQLIKDVSYWLTYLRDKPAIDAEFPVIQKDALALGKELPADAYVGGFANLNLYFKNARLRILYGGGNDYVKIKRRTLMSCYGYKKMTPALAEYLELQTWFYHLKFYVRDYQECRIADAGIDEMIIFRVV